MPPNPSTALNDAAALFFQIETSDKDLLQRLADLLSNASRDNTLPPNGQEAIGRAVWILFDLIEGVAPNADEVLAEIGQLIEQALLSQPDQALLSQLDPEVIAPADEDPGAWAIDTSPSIFNAMSDSVERPLENPGANLEDAPRLPKMILPQSATTRRASPNAVPVRSAKNAAQEPTGGDPLVSTSVDRSLLADFVAECAEYVASAEEGLLILESNREDHEAINAVLRAFHTIKGSAGYVPIPALTRLAHHAESLFMRIRDGEIRCEGGHADLALRSADMVREILASPNAASQTAPALVPPDYADVLVALVHSTESHSSSKFIEPSMFETSPGDSKVMPNVRVVDTSAEIGTDVRSGRLEQVVREIPLKNGEQSSGRRADVDRLDSSIRIRTERLDRLIDMVGELVIAQAMVSQDERLGNHPEDTLSRKVLSTTKIVRELQDLTLAMRMVPLRSTFQRLARVIRDVAHQPGKEVELSFDGEETEIDRNMVDVIADPLVHMVRNSVDHGIETAEKRRSRGKSPVGRIHLAASHSGSGVSILLSDDGNGLDRQRIVEKAVRTNLISADQTLLDDEVFNLLFAPGFSTAETVSDISGRGVGMDVVRRAIETLRGRIELTSKAGEGTTFTVRLPLTLAITDGMIIRVGTERYILPTSSIHKSFQPASGDCSTVVGQGEIVRLRGDLFPVFRLSELFDIPGRADDKSNEFDTNILVVIDDGEKRCALVVNELLGQQQVVAKSLGSFIGRVAGISGGAILGDGRIGLILDPIDLVHLARDPDRRIKQQADTMGIGARSMDRSKAVARQSFMTSDPSEANGTKRAMAGKYLTFYLEDEEYGLEIPKVQEIIGLVPITRVPGTPAFVRRVINLRGKVIPVSNLRLKFDMPDIEPTNETCVIIVEANGLDVGLIVDRVREVLTLTSEQIEAAPDFGADVQTDFLLGMGKAHDRVRILLDIDRVLSKTETIDLRLATQTHTSH